MTDKISVVIPIFNEKESVSDLVDRLHRALSSDGFEYELIFVDDHSNDGTIDELKTLADKFPVRLYTKRGTKGKGQSLLEGFDYADSDIVAMIDADLQYPPEAIPKMLKKIKQHDLDVVVARRMVHKEKVLRQILSKSFSFFFTRLLHNLKVDSQSGLKVFRRSILRDIKLKPQPWTFDLEFLLKARHAGYKIGSHEIVFEERLRGRSKINLFAASWQIGLNAVKLRFKNLLPTHTPPYKPLGMAGAGILHKSRRFVTHTTLSHEVSALQTFTFGQKTIVFSILLLLGLGLAFYARTTAIVFTAILSGIYFIDVVFNLYLVIRSLKNPPEIKFEEVEIQSLDESTLPVYTILCPLYREADVLPHFLDALHNLSWPKQKLDVILLLEEDDLETISAVATIKLPFYIRTLVVPHSNPKTKPKACNYGLAFAKGEYTVVYDAEDIPDPLQLKKAVLGFQKSGEEVKCLQAKLNYHNPHHNFLTRLFTAEYSLWFDVILTGIQSLQTIIPLGGTSNHFRTKDLHALQGWDPFNVTEDCDLGTRLFKMGYKTAIIDSVTLEEANSKIGNWIRQRSRWIKGYLQTYLVHMRQPITFWRQSGSRALHFQLVVGGKIAFIMINPFLWLATILYFTLYAAVGPAIEALYPSVIFYMAVISLVFGNFLFLYYYMIGCAKRGHWNLMKYVFFVPFYWLLTSIAAGIGVYQLFVKPHYWEKTRHGLHLDIKRIIKRKPETKSKAAPSRQPAFSARFLNLLPKSLKNTLFSGVGVLVVAMMFSNLLNFVFNAFLGRVLGFEELALVTFINTLWYIATIFIGALSSTINHRTAYLTAASGRESGIGFLRSILRKSLQATLIFSAAWILAIPFLSEFFRISNGMVLVLFTPALGFGVIAAAYRSYLHGTLFFKKVAAIFAVESVSKLGFAGLFVLLGLADWVYLAIPLSILVSAAAAHRYMVGQGQASPPQTQKFVFPRRFYGAALLSGISATLFLSLDILLVKHYLTATAAGEYVLLSLVGKMVYFFGSLPNVFMMTFVSRDQGLGRDTKRNFRLLFWTSVGLTAVAAVFMGPFGHIFVPILFGAKAAVILPFLNTYSVALSLFTLTNVIVVYHLARKEYIFPMASLVSSVLMSVGIILFHDSVSEIANVVFFTSALGLALIGSLHFIAPELRFVKRLVADLLDLFAPMTFTDKRTGEGKRILIFNWRDRRHDFAGGAEVYVHEMAKRWAQSGHRVTIFCGNDGKSPRSEVVDGIQIIRRGGFYLVYVWAFLYYLLRFRGRYDLIIDCQNGVPFFTPVYAREPIFCLMHHVHQEVFRRSLIRPLAWFASFLEKDLMPLVYRNVKFITVSQSSKAEMSALGIGNAGIEVVHPGVDCTKLVPGAKSFAPMILYLGRLKAYKSIEVLIKAFKLVVDKIPNARLIIAGGGEEEGELKRAAANLDLAKKVEFRGPVSEATKIALLQKSWVFVNPSMMEGWGITTIEASACATPVLASDVPGLRDSVRNPHTGFLIKHGDVPSFAEKIIELLESENLRREIGENGIEWAKNFDWNLTSARFLEIIHDKNRFFLENTYDAEREQV